jgi:glyoxylase-like metal-dependent hydrolase (beta-lactamase superfamily II)
VQERIVIVRKLEVGPFASNCYIIGSEADREGMIIDPGDEAKLILSEVKDLGLDIKVIALTHGHIDHIGALKEVKEATGAQVAIHTDDVRTLKQKLLSIFLGIRHRSPPPPDWLLEDGDTISLGNLKFTVLHTPGHTPGGICLLGEGVLFSGDTLFNYGVGRADLPGGSYSQLIESIRNRLMVLPDEVAVYPGHGPETTIGAERRGNPFLI